ncbi:MAG: AAA family ATPase [Caldilineaceae bacterium]
MAYLELTLLGPCRFALDGAPIAHFESNKVRALLAFLAVEHHHPRSRSGLADLLWAAGSSDAGSNFRRALANLRSVIGDRSAHPPYLYITRNTVQFNLASDVTVDAVRFLDLAQKSAAQPGWVDNLEQAVVLYRGSFLEGFNLDDCPEFELWMTMTREALLQLATGALFRLAEHYAMHAEVERALAHYYRCLALDSCHEAAQRGMMRLLAAHGQRGAALARYTAFRTQLLQDLQVQPDMRTEELVEAIRHGLFDPDPNLDMPGTAKESIVVSTWPSHGPGRVVAGREPQLAILHNCAREVERRRGSIAFVVGEAGSGKTCLLHAFADQLAFSDRSWMCAFGSCTSLLGIGDQYQPFLDIVHELVSSGAEPFGTNLSLAADLLAIQQVADFDRLTRSLECLAQRRPLLLALDNLHWAGAGTIALLYHLAQSLSHRRVLIVGAYRTNSLDKGENEHHLTMAVQELCQQPGGAVIDLDQADGRHFINALLDWQPNHFNEQFRDNLVRHTEGHALFTTEILHALRAAGHLVQGTDGCWQVAGDIDWGAMPPHVHALISERIDSLSTTDRALLNVACIEGDEFTAEIAAAISGINLHSAIDRLSGDLTTQHRLVYATRVRQLFSTSCSCYRFRHHLFRAYLYDALDSVKREQLHRQVTNEIATLRAEQTLYLDL